MISRAPARSVFHILALNLESFLPVVGQDRPDQSIADLLAGLQHNFIRCGDDEADGG